MTERPPSPRDCGCYFWKDGQWHLNWGQHEAGCPVPLVERIEHLEHQLDGLADAIAAAAVTSSEVDLLIELAGWARGWKRDGRIGPEETA